MSSAIRTYRGRAIDRLIREMRQDLGPEAVVVHRSEGRTRGVLGFFQRHYFEIEAMPQAPNDPHDDQPGAAHVRVTRRAERSPFFARASPEQASGASAYVTAYLASLAKAGTHSAIPDLLSEVDLSSPPPAAQPRSTAEPPALPPAAPPAQAPPPTPAPARAAALPPATPPPPASAPVRSLARARAGIEKVLCRRGLSAGFARELTEAAGAHALALAPRAGLARAVRETLAQRIPVASPLATEGGAIVLVGAGGAGKTSVCAALLAAYRSASTLPASFATIVRSAESRELGLILSPQLMRPVPADSPRALQVMRRAGRGALVVIDTPSVSPADRGAVRDLARVLGELEPQHVVVALPATLGLAAAEQLLSGLAPLGPNALALTHADETDQIGVAVEAACRLRLAPEFVLERGPVGGWRLSRTEPVALAERLLS